MSTAKILVVDDEANVRRTMQVALEVAGYQVATAADGEEGERRLREGPRPDLVIVDERMPGIDGLELIRRIRRQDADVTILLATAYGSTQIVSVALREGASGFLEKPFTPQELRDTVAQILKAHAPRGE
jgi:DNA-binding NtrC family response regulator